MSCTVCNSQLKHIFSHDIVGKHKVSYYSCEKCGCLQTENPYWLEEAYSEAIAKADTGLVVRNLITAKKLSVLLSVFFGSKKQYVDVAGGVGLLCRLMRDEGFDYYWDDKFCENVHAKGFEAVDGLEYEVATGFEVMEHIRDPVNFIQEIIDKYSVSTFIFTTELFKDDVPPPESWWYYAFETGQHITFYQRRTLEFISDALDMNLYSFRNFHMLSKRKFSPFLFSLLVSPASRFLIYAIRPFLTPYTMRDHDAMLKS